MGFYLALFKLLAEHCARFPSVLLVVIMSQLAVRAHAPTETFAAFGDGKRNCCSG